MDGTKYTEENAQAEFVKLLLYPNHLARCPGKPGEPGCLGGDTIASPLLFDKPSEYSYNRIIIYDLEGTPYDNCCTIDRTNPL